MFASSARASWLTALSDPVARWKTVISAPAIAASIDYGRVAAWSAAPVNERSSIGRTTPWRRGLSARLAWFGHDLLFVVEPALRLLPELGDFLAPVNNAGVIFEGDFASIALENHLRLRRSNVALTLLTHLFLPAMIARGGGRILKVASIAAFMPVPRLATYAAAKAYVLLLTESLSQELSVTGVTATALCPGLTDTAMVRGSHLARVVPAPTIMSPKDVAEPGCAGASTARRFVSPASPIAR